jgi:hypothetical protein
MEGIYSLEDIDTNEMLEYIKTSPYNEVDGFYQMDVFRQRQIIKQKYEKILPHIIKNKSCYVDPYIVNWHGVINENEYNLFERFRAIGTPMYPQYPVGKYWLDFGNPYYKVGIEADSKAHHDLEKDIIRDRELQKMGWKVYHIPSRLSFTQKVVDTSCVYDDDEEYEPVWKEYLTETLDGVLECISRSITGYHYFVPDQFRDLARQVQQKYLLI